MKNTSKTVHVPSPASPLNDIHHEVRDEELFHSFNSASKAEEARVAHMEEFTNGGVHAFFLSSDDEDQSESSVEDRPLVKKSSLRHQGSPPPNKNVSFNQSVMRQTEFTLTVERLKPAAESMPSRGWMGAAPHFGHEYYGYHVQQYYRTPSAPIQGPGRHSHYHNGYYTQSFPQRRSGHHSRPARRNRRRGSAPQNQNTRVHNPSAMLSAWIDRDN